MGPRFVHMDKNLSTPVEPIRKKNLKQQLLDFFIEQIESGAFPVGSRIPDEITLATQLNVSRNILRESMKILESNGVLETQSGRGTIVPPCANANIQSMQFFEQLRENTTLLQLFDARLILEPQIAYYACQRRNKRDIAHLRKIVKQTYDPKKRMGNPDDYDFHVALARISGNDTLTDFLRTIFCYLREGEFGPINIHLSSLLRERSQRDHEIILQNIVDGDGNAARDNMTRHLMARIALIRNIYHPDLDMSELTPNEVMEAIKITSPV